MRTEDLFLKYAQVINMCEGTKVKPWEGVREPITKEFHRTNRHPDFSMPPEKYEFMVAVLEDRPVFVGDTVWHIQLGKYLAIQDVSHIRVLIECDHATWKPPKKTFMLNGEELPCPQKDYSAFNLDFNSWSPAGRKNGRRYYFKSESDLCAVTDKIRELLQDATK